MPRADDPRVMVRLTPEDHAAIKAAAAEANVSVGGLMRECAVRFAAQVAREARDGSVRIRRAKAVEAVKGQVATAASLVAVTRQRDPDAWARQQKLNAARDRK